MIEIVTNNERIAKLEAEREELSTLYNHACARIDSDAERIADLKEELQAHDDYYRIVVNDECAPDEVHCTCVPALRKKIDNLEAELERSYPLSPE